MKLRETWREKVRLWPGVDLNFGKDSMKKFVNRTSPHCKWSSPIDSRRNYTIRSPRNSDNIDLSIPHRFLSILLVRGSLPNCFLEDEDCLARLIGGNEYTIELKPAASEKLVFLKGGPQGLSLSDNAPISTQSFSEYLEVHERDAGFVSSNDSLGITLYAWRGGTGNTI
jgi:hypothetical protein